jgi:hypothetical protein
MNELQIVGLALLFCLSCACITSALLIGSILGDRGECYKAPAPPQRDYNGFHVARSDDVTLTGVYVDEKGQLYQVLPDGRVEYARDV